MPENRTTPRVVEYVVEAGVATITLNRPERRNAIDVATRDQLNEASNKAIDDDTVRAIVMTGAGGHFCAGGDVKALDAVERMTAEAGRRRMRTVHTGMRRLFESDKPVIAAVDGCAYGGGFGLALLADMVIATPSARFCMSFLKVGLVPDCGALYTLARSIGLHRAKAMMLSCREVDAQTGLDWGFVNEVVPAASLQAHAHAIAQNLARGPAQAIALTKHALNQSQHSSFSTMLEVEANAQGIAFASDDHRAAASDFAAKRPSRFAWV
ncbi:MAG: enoyl-CoA hydratase/isomerase family protein [Pseudomonadota bacterium]